MSCRAMDDDQILNGEDGEHEITRIFCFFGRDLYRSKQYNYLLYYLIIRILILTVQIQLENIIDQIIIRPEYRFARNT